MVTAVRLALLVVVSASVWRSSFGVRAQDAGVKIKVSDKWFVDGLGRVRLFHGINQVQKSFPWYPQGLQNETFIANLKDWGFNALRLGTMWSGVEIGNYQYNETYLKIMTGIVNSLTDNGIYVIFDMHQDALSTAFDSYDGMPRWLLDLLPAPSHSYPWPFKKQITWVESYLTEACGTAFQQLYHNVSDSVGHLSGFWKKVASTFKDNPYVLGYELINEPWAGDVFSNPLLLLPGEAGSKNLLPLYDEVNAAIRQVDNETILFYEPVTWGVFFNNKVVGTGFDRVPGGDEYKDRSALAWHYYCWLLKQTNDGGPDPLLNRMVCDDIVLPKVFTTVEEDVKKTGGAAFLTEFGICSPNMKSNGSVIGECDAVITMANTFLQSWTYWDSIFYDGHGNVLWDTVELFSRPYAQAIAGTPLEMTFNSTSGSFRLVYICNTAVKGATEIYASKLHYPNGYSVQASAGLKWLQDGNILYVQAVTGTPSQPCTVNLTQLAPRPPP